MLARTFEAAGLSTVLVTPMPFWAERVGVPRALAVEFPFGQILGAVGDVAQQRRIVKAALSLLEEASAPGTLVHAPESWSRPQQAAREAWQPAQASPIIAHMTPHVLQAVRRQRSR